MSDKIKVVNAADFQFRYEDKTGPKYVARGPNVDVGLVRIQRGEDFKTHYHNVVEEIFFTTLGECEIYIDGEKHLLRKGDLVQVPPKSNHYLRNTTSDMWEAVFIKSPYDPKDRIDVEWLPE
jgi:quercetin dioxygenase-like cupin family protein